MVNIPGRFKRMAAAFDEMSRARSCESSGSEHSAADLSDMVNSFLEREIREQRKGEDDDLDRNVDEIDDESDQNSSPDFELQNSLKELFDREDDDVRRGIFAEVEKALYFIGGDKSSPEFKRRLMARLRSSGFDAGLCKSKWEKNGRNPSGNYEYIDVDAGGNRYIVEIDLAGEFTIARPTVCYASLLDVFPRIFVGKPDDVKQVVRQMSRAIRKSLKSSDLEVPPWRRLAYMQSKWFSSYKRTSNEIPRAESFKGFAAEKSVGFSPVKATAAAFSCSKNFAAKHGFRVGNLSAALSKKEMML